MERNNRMTTRLLMMLCGLAAAHAAGDEARAAPLMSENRLAARRAGDRFRGGCLAFTGGAKKAATYAAVGTTYGLAAALCHTPAAPFVIAAAPKAHLAIIAASGGSGAGAGLWTNRQAQRTQEITDAQRAENAGLAPRTDRPSVADVQANHEAARWRIDLPVHRDPAAVVDAADAVVRFKQASADMREEVVARFTPQCWTEFRKRATDAELLQAIADGQARLGQLDLDSAARQAEGLDALPKHAETRAKLADMITFAQEEFRTRELPSTLLARTELVDVSTSIAGDQTLLCGYKQGHDPKGVADWKARNAVKMLPLSSWRVGGMLCAHLPCGPREVVAYWLENGGYAFAHAHPLLATAMLYGPAPGGWGMAIQPFTTWAGYELGEWVSRATTFWGECCLRADREGTECCFKHKPANEFIRWRQGPIWNPTIQSKETRGEAVRNMRRAGEPQVRAVADAIMEIRCDEQNCQARGECWALEKLQSDLGMSFPTLPYKVTDQELMNDARMRADDDEARRWRADLLREAILDHIMANEHKLGTQVGYVSNIHGDWINIPKLGALVPQTSVYYTDDEGVQQFARVLHNEEGDYYGDHAGTIRLEIFSHEDANDVADRVIEEIQCPAKCDVRDTTGRVEIHRTQWEHALCDRLMESPAHNFHNKKYMQLWGRQYVELSRAINALGLPLKDPRPSTGGHH